METVVDEKQIKQEVETAQKVADANKVIIPVKTEEVVSKDMKHEVKAVQKEVSKTPVEIPVKLTNKDIQDELNKLVKQKGKSQEEVKAKLDELMKGMDLSDVVKDSIKDLFLKYRSMANSKKGFSSASTKSKDEFINVATNFSKKTQTKKSNALVRALTELTAGQAQAFRNEKSPTSQLRKRRQDIYDEVSAARARQDAARENVKKAHYEEQKATAFVEGRPDSDDKTTMKDVYIGILERLAESKAFTISETNNGKNKKAVEYWGSPEQWDPFIKIFENYLNKGLLDYKNRGNIVPEARAEYERVTEELEAIEAEAVKQLEEINKILGPVKTLFRDDSFTPRKMSQDMFKETPISKKYKLRKRTLTDDVADAAINRDFLKKLGRGASRAQAGTPGADINLGLRQSVMDGPYIDKKRIVRTAIGGPYADTNSYERLTAETRKASDKLAKETFLRFIVSVNNLSKFLEERNKQLRQEAEKNGHTFIGDEGRNKNEVTELEKNRHLSQIATNEAIKELKKINKGKPNANVGAMQESLKASFGFLTKSFGPSMWEGLSQNVNAFMAQFAGGTFKITDDPIKGEGKNYHELAKLLSENFKDINDFFAKNPEMEKLAEAARQLKVAAQIGQDAFEQSLKDNAKILQAFGYTPGRLVVTPGTKKSGPAVSGNTQLSRYVQDLVKNAEKQINYTKLGNVEGEETTESIKVTDTTGTDSEAGKNEVVSATEGISTTIKDTFSNINGNSFGGGNGGNGGSNNLGDTGPSILEQIRDLLVNISAYTTAIFDILPRLKLTIKREKRSKKKDTIEPPKPNIPEIENPFGFSMEMNKVWDDIAEQFKNFIKPLNKAFHPVIAGELRDRTEEKLAGKKIIKDVTDTAKIRHQRAVSDANLEYENMTNYYKNKKFSKIGLSQVISSAMEDVKNGIKKAFRGSVNQTEIERLKNLNQKDRERELAERRHIFGIADSDKNASATGDKGRAFRMKSVYGYKNAKNPFKDLKLTPGLEVDSKGITEAIQNMIEDNMFSAQTGVNNLGDAIKLSFGGIGMPSLEKSRAQADAANEIMSMIRQVVQELLQAIQSKETDLRGMEARGDAKFNEKGVMVSGSDEAWTTFGQLEETKMALNGVIAEMGIMDQLAEATGNNMTEFFRVLGFVSPELKKCNGIIENINAGLNKNGKALKFQTRFQETLNYSFQLLTRHVGQIIKNWMMMLNPINLIKKAFSDFASYDVKWQRTMNVIKYNLRRVIKPFMEWLAQQFVNLIGLANALVKGIGKAFGQNWDLFDKSAASAEKMNEELEAASNVSAGFDELHDIGSDNSGANDLSGDIYTPQWEGLNKIIEDFGEKVGKVFKGIKDLTEGWDFWDWLIMAGLALAGFTALKWLLGMFTGKNPLESVAKGFKTLQTTVGWAILIWAFTSFTEALTGFVECMKTAIWDDVWKTLTTLAGALILVVGSIVALAKWVTLQLPALLGLAVVVGVFALLTWVLAKFVETVKGVENLGDILAFFAASIMTVAAAVALLLGVLTLIVATGVGTVAIVALAGILAVVALVIASIALLVTAIGQYSDELIAVMDKMQQMMVTWGAVIVTIIQTIANGISQIVMTIAIAIIAILQTVTDAIIAAIDAIANGIKTILEPILDFMDSVMDKVVELAVTIAHEIGETIRTVIETVGNVILGIINSIVSAIPDLLDAIIDFINDLGPAIERFATGLIRTITRVVNFTVSAFEHLLNVGVDLINGLIYAANCVPGVSIGYVPKAKLSRLDLPQYEVGTNYVPNDGLAYLHRGEAVIPKKYNQPYQPGTLSAEERMYMTQMMNTMRSLDSTMKQGITVNGQFVQRGSDLVAVVNKTKSQSGADLLSNVSYAR